MRGHQVSTSNTMRRILTINTNGLREKRNRLQLGRLLFNLQIRVCIITETHLREHELKWLKIPNYRIVTQYCRRVKSKIGGGVIILVHAAFNAKLNTKDKMFGKGVETC